MPGSFHSHNNAWFIMQVEFKENCLCVRCDFLYEESFSFAEHSELLAFTHSSKEMHGYFKVFKYHF